MSTAILAECSAPPGSCPRERGGRGVDARKGGSSHPNSSLPDGQCASANGTREEKKLILKLNPSLKFMAEDGKSFASAAPMLFGEEFAKQATTTVEQVKAMKKLNVPSEKKGLFSGYHPRSFQSSCEGGAKSGCARYQPYHKGGNQTGQSSSRQGQNNQDQRT